METKGSYLTEKEVAIQMATMALDVPNADPDDDLRTISRQFLRSLEKTDTEIKDAYEVIYRLEDDLHNSETENDHLKEKISKLNDCIGRLENDLSDGVKILETIWIAFDRDYLMKSLLSSDYENLKNYLGK